MTGCGAFLWPWQRAAGKRQPHVLFYRPADPASDGGGILVVRVLHQSMDAASPLSEPQPD